MNAPASCWLLAENGSGMCLRLVSHCSVGRAIRKITPGWLANRFAKHGYKAAGVLITEFERDGLYAFPACQPLNCQNDV
jgi:hypothetical protein